MKSTPSSKVRLRIADGDFEELFSAAEESDVGEIGPIRIRFDSLPCLKTLPRSDAYRLIRCYRNGSGGLPCIRRSHIVPNRRCRDVAHDLCHFGHLLP